MRKWCVGEWRLKLLIQTCKKTLKESKTISVLATRRQGHLRYPHILSQSRSHSVEHPLLRSTLFRVVFPLRRYEIAKKTFYPWFNKKKIGNSSLKIFTKLSMYSYTIFSEIRNTKLPLLFFYYTFLTESTISRISVSYTLAYWKVF